MKLMAIISVVFAPLFLAINGGGGLISYVVPTTAAFAASTDLMVLPGAASTSFGPGNLLAAFLFAAGGFIGMGGMFIATRVHVTPQSVILRESLKKPLLVR